MAEAFFSLKFTKPIRDSDEEGALIGDARKAFRKEVGSAMSRASQVLKDNTIAWATKSGYRPEGATVEGHIGQSPYVGTSPQPDSSGPLYQSFQRMAPRISEDRATSGIRSYHPGAGRVEWGTTDRRGIRTYPHPYMNPAAKESEEQIDAIFDELLEDV